MKILVILFNIIFFAHVWAEQLITVVSVQLHSGDVGNFAKMRALVKQAKTQHVDLVIFREDSVFGWLNPEVFIKAAPIPGKYSDELIAIAKDEHVWLAAGLAEQGPKAGAGAHKDAHQVYDTVILINPDGEIILHHRQFNVVKNAFLPEACKQILNQDQCSYIPGELSDIKVISTVFGKTAILVCSDAYTYSPAEALEVLLKQQANFVIVSWGITASRQNECGTSGFNAAKYASEAAVYLKNAFVVGANAVGPRVYGRFLPSVYCGTSGYATPTGQVIEAKEPLAELVFFHISKKNVLEQECMKCL
ncbi:MAG: carbon-nitrogen hydrolase family protein [Myxococcaceae bacterium]